MTPADEFVEFAQAAAPRLRRTAFLLCGDWHTAEDLTQSALAKVFVSWRRIRRRDAAHAYATRTLVNTYLADKSCGGSRRCWPPACPTGRRRTPGRKTGCWRSARWRRCRSGPQVVPTGAIRLLSAANTIARKRAVLSNVLDYAVGRGLDANPLPRAAGMWNSPKTTEGVVDPQVARACLIDL